jgi:DNA-binding GntR family transcriptional regulator
VYKVEYQDLSQQVYGTLKRMILSGQVRPGEKLRQDELASELGVSRTPLLSAFSKLEKELLVETIPRRGTIVRRYTKDELIHLYDIRVRLEPLGARKATEHASDEEIAELVAHCERFSELTQRAQLSPEIKEEDYFFHMRIMAMSRNELLYNIVSSYNVIVVANVYGFFKDPVVSAGEHRTIVTAIRDRDPDAAETAMKNHVESSRALLLDHDINGGPDG